MSSNTGLPLVTMFQLGRLQDVGKVIASLKPSRIALSQARTVHTSDNRLKKFYKTPREAVHGIPDGSKILVGGFGICGVPNQLLEAFHKTFVKDLTVVTQNPGEPHVGLGHLFDYQQISKLITSFVTEFQPQVERLYMMGKLDLEFTPQGTLAERLRAGGAGIPAFYTPTGAGTMIEEGVPIRYGPNGEVLVKCEAKEAREFNGIRNILEEAITGDYALVKAWKADKAGNLRFRGTSRNFNSAMCRAAKCTIAEVEEIVEVGEIQPEDVHIPHVYVHRICQVEKKKTIHKFLIVDSKKQMHMMATNPAMKMRTRILRRAALEFRDGMCVNVGYGMPMMAACLIPKGMQVTIEADNGVVGVGPYATNDEVDEDFVNSANFYVKIAPGGSVFGSEDSFGMVRGGHIDMTMLGAMEVSCQGDLANWMIPGQLVRGPGGAMDLISCPKTKVIITMEHCAKNGGHKILKNCTLPITGRKCVDRIITEMCVFDVDHEKGLVLKELADDFTVDDVKKRTGCEFIISPDLKPMAGIEIQM